MKVEIKINDIENNGFGLMIKKTDIKNAVRLYCFDESHQSIDVVVEIDEIRKALTAIKSCK